MDGCWIQKKRKVYISIGRGKFAAMMTRKTYFFGQTKSKIGSELMRTKECLETDIPGMGKR
jgi:hypothetical protein